MKEYIRDFFIGDGNKKNVMFWTGLSGITVSGTSIITLLIITRFLGVVDGGIYSIGLAVSQQLSSIGTLCLRTFQASDISKKYSLSEYKLLRLLSCISMFAVSILWVTFHNYDMTKIQVVLVMCMYKVIESYGDMYEGIYQRNDRFDISGKSYFIKSFVALLVSLFTIFISNNLLLAMSLMTVVYFVLFIIIDLNLIDYFEEDNKVQRSWTKISELFVVGLPIFINSYLMLYINNASKYSIDTYCDEATVTVFNILYMPAFCINLLVSFIARPLIVELAKKLEEGYIDKIKRILLKEVILVITIGLVVILAMYTIGVPILGFVYGVDISLYKIEFVIVLLGGAFYAMYTVFYYMITILRRQIALLVSCLVGALITVIVMPILVNKFGMLGASIGYAGIMFLVMVICVFFTMLYLVKYKDKEKEA